MKPRRVYLLLALIGLATVLLITGHMDTDWRVVDYYFDMNQSTHTYWEYCPFLLVNWWLAYFIDIVKIASGWCILGATLTYIGLALLGKLKDA